MARTTRLLLASCLWALPAPATLAAAAGGQCFDYETDMHILGAVNTRGAVVGVAVSGDFACTASDTAGIEIIDITDPVAPTLAGSLDVPGQTRGVAARDGYAFVAATDFHVIDIRDPSNPLRVAGVDAVGDYMDGLFMVGDFAFSMEWSPASYGFSGIGSYDVSEPLSPVRRYSYYGAGRAVAGGDDHLYVAQYRNTLSLGIFNVPDGRLTRIGEIPDVGPTAAAYRDDRLHVVTYSGGYRIYDVSHPESPVELGGIDGFEDPIRVAADGNFAYVLDDAGMHVVDVNDPTTPVRRGTTTGGSALVVNEGIAYVGESFSSQRGFKIVDVSSAVAPLSVTHFHLTGRTGDVAFHGGMAYLANTDIGLGVFDVSDPLVPRQVATMSDPAAYGPPSRVAFYGDHAYVAEGFLGGLLVYDNADPRAPVLLRRLTALTHTYDVAVKGDRAFVLDRETGLLVYDLGDPLFPRLVAEVALPGRSTILQIEGDHAYVGGTGASTPQLYVIDITTPDEPRLKTTVDRTSSVRDLAVMGNWLLAGSGEGVDIIDVSTPANPRPAASVPIVAAVGRIHVDRSLAYVATSEYRAGGTALVLDLANPRSPRTIGTIRVSEFAGTASPYGDYLYVTAVKEGLHVFPSQCRRPAADDVREFRATPHGTCMRISWVADGGGPYVGFDVYRSRAGTQDYDRVNPQRIGGTGPLFYDDCVIRPGEPYRYLLAAVDAEGREARLAPITATLPAPVEATELTGVAPTPFREAATVAFALAEPSHVRLAIYDVTGRLVRVLVDDAMGYGVHRAAWEGRDDAGLRVAGGTYFVRLAAGDVSRTRKVVFLGGR